MTSLAWNPDGGSYAVATLSEKSATLATAHATGTGFIYFTHAWLAEDGSTDGSPGVVEHNGTAYIVQTEDGRPGLLTVIAHSDGLSSNGIVLMILAEDYGSNASDGSAMTAPTPAPEGLTAPYDLAEHDSSGNGIDTGANDRTLEFRCDWIDEAQGVGHYVTVDIEIDGDTSNTDQVDSLGSGVFTVPAYLDNDGDYSIRIRAVKNETETSPWSDTITISKTAVIPPPEYRLYWPIDAGLDTPNLAYEFTFYSGSPQAGIEAYPVHHRPSEGLSYVLCGSAITYYSTTREDDPPIPFYSVRVQIEADGESQTITNTLDGSEWDPLALTGPDLPLYDPNIPPEEAVLPRSSAGLKLTASGLLSHYPAIGGANQIRLQGQLALLFSSAGQIITRKLLKVIDTFRFTAKHTSAQPPAGLQSQLREELNPLQPDDPARYLQVWFIGHPNHHAITARIDDGAGFTPAFIWQNPGTIDPAILKIPLSGLPGDGSTHIITISVSQNLNGQVSPAATATSQARLPLPKPPQPLTVNARLIRQGTEEIPDLVEVSWTATSGVVIGANLRPQGWSPGQDPAKLAGKTVKLGYGNESENTMAFEGIGSRFEFATGSESSVFFSVAEIRNNEVGPPLFTLNPLRIRAYKAEAIEPKTPDERAGTAVDMGSQTLRYHLADGYSGLNATIAQYAYDKLLLRIKNIVAKGGSVTLDDLGRFETRWSASKLTKGPAGTFYTKPAERSVTFIPSIGFKEGTERGRS
ncbi:MAG: hypothetical protein HC889_16860 [Synechococcaceae cyanobacterium SM1_2_3]|nr:hypothetical protein [Synechococcaceae cyanobacterium SM1_2_3]